LSCGIESSKWWSKLPLKKGTSRIQNWIQSSMYVTFSGYSTYKRWLFCICYRTQFTGRVLNHFEIKAQRFRLIFTFSFITFYWKWNKNFYCAFRLTIYVSMTSTIKNPVVIRFLTNLIQLKKLSKLDNFQVHISS